MRDIIKTLINRGEALHERNTPYNGPFSYSGEFHSFTLGVVAGLLTVLTGEAAIAATVGGAIFAEASSDKSSGISISEMRKEPWYAGGGLIVGIAIALPLAVYLNI